jgi:hypothetical protein
MTSREHARRLMLILLASEGTALRRAGEDRTAQSDRSGRGGEDGQGSSGTEADGKRERGGDEWRTWIAATPLGAA